MTEPPSLGPEPASPESSLATAVDAVEGEPLHSRFDFEEGLRSRTARGVVVNAAFQVGFAAIGLLQRFVIAAFLTTREFGIWGLVLTSVLTLSFLKQVGISDKYVQQNEPDQEVAFQKAFTLELVYTLAFCVVVAVALPLYALAYDRPEVLLPSAVLALTLVGSALTAPVWIAWRQMRFARQRLLESVNPVVSTAVMIPLAATGHGYWSLVIGILAGTFAAAATALVTCPYRLALRLDRHTLRAYVGFSWPLVVAGGSTVLVLQGTMLVGNYAVGLAGVGAIALASSLLVFANRVDAVISQTMYPAVCAVRDRLDLLHEAFTKSNRLALMWGLPFGVGMALFAPDLVEFLLGRRWEAAVGLLQALGLLIGINQLGFNWTLFFQARGDTRPQAVTAVVGAIVFVAVVAPLMFALDLTGYAIGIAVSVASQLAVRTTYLSGLFEGFNPLRHAVRAVAPCIAAVLPVIGARLLESGSRTLGTAGAEFTLYAALTVLATLACERRLIREVAGYLRGGREPRVAVAADAGRAFTERASGT